MKSPPVFTWQFLGLLSASRVSARASTVGCRAIRARARAQEAARSKRDAASKQNRVPWRSAPMQICRRKRGREAQSTRNGEAEGKWRSRGKGTKKERRKAHRMEEYNSFTFANFARRPQADEENLRLCPPRSGGGGFYTPIAPKAQGKIHVLSAQKSQQAPLGTEQNQSRMSTKQRRLRASAGAGSAALK